VANDTFRITLGRVRFADKQVTSGLNLLRLTSMWEQMLYTTEDLEPILVRQRPDGDYDLIDGRHRWTSCLGAGRQDILARLET
jgi:hypothetical protein